MSDRISGSSNNQFLEHVINFNASPYPYPEPLLNQSSVYIVFLFVSDGSNTNEGIYLDDVSIDLMGTQSNYNVVIDIWPYSAGTTTGAGIYNYQQLVTVIAHPDPEWYFEYWVENNNIISSDTIMQFIIEGNRNLTAIFNQELPTGPTNLEGYAISGTEIYLSWEDNSFNEWGYKVYDMGWNIIETLPPNSTSYLVNGLTAFNYHFRVIAYNRRGNSPTNLIGPINPGYLISPIISQVTPISPFNIAIFWNDYSTNEDGFIIEHSVANTNNWTIIDSVAINDTSYQDISLLPFTKYFYRLRAYNSTGISEYSNVVSATTPHSEPASPYNLIALPVSDTKINLTWVDRSDVEIGFKIERKKGAAGVWAEIDSVLQDVVTYQDSDLITNSQYYYRVRAYNIYGYSVYSNTANATITEIADYGIVNGLPQEYKLYENYPNPFNPSTTIIYAIPKATFVTIKLFDLLGDEIETLVEQFKPAGYYEVTFNARNLPSGVYLYKLQAGSFVETKKMILLK